MQAIARRALMGLALAVILFAGALASAGEAVSVVSAEADASRPFLVKIHADWCGTCNRLEAPLSALRESHGSEIRYVTLDVTDRAATDRAGQEAERLGIKGFFDAHKGKTGTVAVIHGVTRQPVAVFKGELDGSVYEAALEAARKPSST